MRIDPPNYDVIEKQPLLDEEPVSSSPVEERQGAVDESHIDLNVGKSKRGWGFKVIVALLIAYIGMKVYGAVRIARHAGWFGDREGPEHFDEVAIIPANYTEGIALYDGYMTANATFPFVNALNIEFEDDAEVYIADEIIEQGEIGLITVESTYTDRVEGVALIAGFDNILEIKKSSATHKVHLVLPSNADLSINTPNTLKLSSAIKDFNSLSLKANRLEVPDFINAEELKLDAELGDVKGKFNVTRSLVLRSITGDIDAEVFVIPPPFMRGNHSRPGGHCRGRKGHRGHKGKGFMSWIFGPKEHDKPEGDEDMEKPERPPHSPERRPGPPGGGRHGPPPRGPPHRGPGGPPRRGPGGPRRPGPGRRPHGPPPHPHIFARSSTGSVSLDVHKPRRFPVDMDAFSHTGDVTVHSKNFTGFFAAGTFVGNLTVTTGDKKEVKVIKEVVGEEGGFIKGFVKPIREKKNATEIDEMVIQDEAEEGPIEETQPIMDEPEMPEDGEMPSDDDMPPPEDDDEPPFEEERPPHHKGPEHGKHPHKKPGHGDEHKPHRKGPGHHKGPEHHGPGREHRRPGPPGRGPRGRFPPFSKVKAHTDVGTIKLAF